MTRLSESVPPVEVSRLLLAALVAAGAVVSIAAQGRLSNFAGGFAAGAGSAFVLSFLRGPRPPAAEGPPREGTA
jgi:hypothetical protein